MERLTQKKPSVPLWLGLTLEDTVSRTGQRGVRVTAVQPGTPAHAAGIKPGDVIARFNSAALNSWRDYLGAMRNQVSAEPVDLEVLANGSKTTRKLRPVPFDEQTVKKLLAETWGLEVDFRKGKVVIENAAGPASFLQKGDVIYAVQQERVTRPEDLYNVFRRERMAPEVILGVIRGNRDYYARLLPGRVRL